MTRPRKVGEHPRPRTHARRRWLCSSDPFRYPLMRRCTLLVLALATAALAGCNLDFVTGEARPRCSLVTVDTIYAISTEGDTVAVGYVQIPDC